MPAWYKEKVYPANKEKDLLQTLQAADVVSDSGPANVITPQPVRPVGSSIILECIQVKPNPIPGTCASKKSHEVEAEIEAEALPVVVSDSSNRVRLANSAYKEMVWQPECLWLDSMVSYDVMLGENACKRISGKICMEADFGRSMFERLVLLGQMKHLLDVQYRMHPAISLFPNSMFYGNRISDASSVRESIYKKDLLQGDMYGPYSFINVGYGNEVLVNGHSPRNPVESALVSEIVAKLYEGEL